jgi:hypothetical protein
VDLRSGNGTVRTLATFPDSGYNLEENQIGSGRLAWSADGGKVAWLANGQVGELIISSGQVREWRCNCGSIVFRGQQLLSDDYAAASAPALLSYPDDGSNPAQVTISGLPKSKFAGGTNTFTLDADISSADVIVGYGMGVSVAGGPQTLYRVDSAGRAVVFTPPLGNSVPADFMLSPDGTQVSFLVPSLAGVCADYATPMLTSTATGGDTPIPMPAGTHWAIAAWFGPSGTLYASMAPTPPGCAHTFTSVPSFVTSVLDYRLQAGTWVRSGNGIINQQLARDGWDATLYSASITSNGLGIDPASGSLKLVLSNGPTSVTVPGALAFLWAP